MQARAHPKTVALEAALPHAFTRPELLTQALTHRSYGVSNNERLEFLGDSVLNCTVAHALYARFPALPEGSLSRLRANLVRQETLAEVAQKLRLGEALLLGEGEVRSGGDKRPSILADAFESIVGAVFLDAGFDAAAAVVRVQLEALIAAIDPNASGKDAKTELQELLQSRRLPLPEYTLVNTVGSAHEQDFTVECAIAKLKLSTRGSGKSRRAAEQEAARLACAKLQA
jgi:ribonuclease-3